MRKLHVVGFTSDLDGLIFSTRKGAKSGSFVVSIGDELLEKLDEVQRLRTGGDLVAPGPQSRDDRERRSRPESSLTPREIQSRLRAGRTIDEVAREAGVDTNWVERFAAPILAEQRQVVELARSLTFTKTRLGESAEPLGESVAANLVERGVWLLDDEFNGGWSAFQVRDGVWTVRFRYRSRGRLQQGTWELDVANNRLISRDRLGSDLGYVAERARRRRRLAEGAEEPAEAAPESSPVVVRVAARRATVTAAGPGVGRARPSRRPPAAPAEPATRARGASKGKPATTRGRTAAAKAPAGGKAAATGKAARPARTPTPPTPAAKAAKAAKVAKVAKGRPAAPTKAPVKAPAKTAVKAPVKAPAKVVTAGKAARTPRATKGRGGERSAPAPPTAPSAEASPRARRPLAPRPAGPRFGTDGTRLGTGPAGPGRRPGRTPPASSRRPDPAPAPAARSFRPEPPPARSRPDQPGSGNGAAPSPAAARLRPAPEPPRQPPPPRPVPAAVRPAPPPVDDDLEFDLDLDVDLDVDDDDTTAEEGPAPAPAPAAAPAPGERRPAIAIGPPPEEARNEERGGDGDAFVIRPRISARQASELRFDPDGPRRWKPPPEDITAVPPTPLPAQF
ncbi:MAG: septation protein SepH [Acidimicrobiia bacterium]